MPAQAQPEFAERITRLDNALHRVCFTCGEAYVGLTDKACPFCGSTVLAAVRLPDIVGRD